MYVLGERGAWGGLERRKPPYRPRPGVVRRSTALFLFLFFLSAIPSPRLWHSSAYFLLYCCTADVLLSCTALWVRGLLLDVFFLQCACCAVLLLYYVLLLYFCCTGWLGGSVRGCVHGFVGFFLCFVFFPAMPAPRWHSSAYH